MYVLVEEVWVACEDYDRNILEMIYLMAFMLML